MATDRELVIDSFSGGGGASLGIAWALGRGPDKVLNAADYGAPTHRRRLFLVARCDGLPIVWPDIRTGRLLPCEDERESEEEQHVCRLQLDVIDRCLTLWSAPGDVVLSPFAGVGSEVHQAVATGRRAIACELKPTYYRQAVRALRAAAKAAAGEPAPGAPEAPTCGARQPGLFADAV